MTCRYFVIRCLGIGTPFRSSPYPAGPVEIRSIDYDTKLEKEAIRQSRHAYHEGEDDHLSIRVCTIVEAPDVIQALAISEVRIDEALDVIAAINSGSFLSNYRLLQSGCIRDLSSGQVFPKLPKLSPDSLSPFKLFLMDPGGNPPRDLAQFIMAAQPSDLATRYSRSAHWSRKSDIESNPHISMLFAWVAAESIWSLKKDDDDIISDIQWSLGFINGQRIQLLSATTIAATTGSQDYRSWNRHIGGLLQRLRIIRNSIVHNGFRFADLSPEELLRFGKLAKLVAIGAQNAVVCGIKNGISTLAELREYLPLVLEPSLLRICADVVGAIANDNAMI